MDRGGRDRTGASASRSIAVFCGSSAGRSPTYRSVAEAVGVALAERGCRLVYGGGHVGLMGAVADATLSAGGSVTGVITEQLLALEVAHQGLTELEVVADMHLRKARMAELADGVIVLPGGFGTFEEMFEILTWNQLGILSMPVVLLDVDGFYTPLVELVAGAVQAGFMRPDHGALLVRVEDPADAVDAALAPAAAYVPKWVGSR
ncbi:MAG: TIGR00730 family Rossman fold protein [Ilumatobacter sp.]|uniref:LOG family protein n=1 Tax=Ilumatobacter sp. TaxID=1967498 RepID=UPI0032984268